jgi:hypothetical protein
VRSGLCPGVTLEAELSVVDLTAENLLQLSLSAQTAKPACGRVVCPSAAIIYDFIRLERESRLSRKQDLTSDLRKPECALNVITVVR